jgi:hypothetical protein
MKGVSLTTQNGPYVIIGLVKSFHKKISIWLTAIASLNVKLNQQARRTSLQWNLK